MGLEFDRKDLKSIADYSAQIARLRESLATRIVGQEAIVTQVLAAVFSEGHCLIIGVPGLAKTLLVRSLAELFTLDFSRIQFSTWWGI